MRRRDDFGTVQERVLRIGRLWVEDVKPHATDRPLVQRDHELIEWRHSPTGHIDNHQASAARSPEPRGSN